MKKIKVLIGTLIFFLFLFVQDLLAQESHGGFPLSIRYGLNVEIPSITLPSINNEDEIQISDTIGNGKCGGCENSYYGKGISDTIDIKKIGHLSVISNGTDSTRIWLIQLESLNAYGMQFYFNKFKIPPGGALYFYNSDTSMILGAFTYINNPQDSTRTIPFGTQYIKGKKIFIEYSEPYNPIFEGELKIVKVIHIFKNVFEHGPFTDGASSLSCEKNVTCPLGSGWEAEINSVAIILKYDATNGYSGWCSGAVLNNTSQDGTPYFLTAKHCMEDDGSHDIGFDYSSWTILFNHQTQNCSDDGSTVGNGTNQSTYGPSLIASDGAMGAGLPTSDYLLLQLNVAPLTLTSWGVCYAGWTRGSNSPSAPVVGIHHPQGDVKKISKADDSPVTSCNSFFWKVKWNYNLSTSEVTDGETEPGSSGSPLFDQDHHVVGQLHGKNHCYSQTRNCNTVQYSDYGKFSEDWANSGATGFAFYLDPTNSGVTSVDTYCPSGNNGSIGVNGPSGHECLVGLDAGMFINGFQYGIPCIQNDIVLSPYSDCEHPIWRQIPTILSEDCDPLCSSNMFSWFTDQCDCAYEYYFIEIMEVDENLSFIQSTAHSKWFRFELDYTNGSALLNIPSIVVNQNTLNDLGMILQAGKLYRIKLAAVDGCWCEQMRYFRRGSPGNIDLNNPNLTTDLVGSHITLSNTHVTHDITVRATNDIIINSNSTLDKGLYIIDDLVCNESGRMSSSSHQHSLIVGTSGSNESLNQLQTKLDSLNESDFTIIPNPNNGLFEINISDNSSSEDQIHHLKIYDMVNRLLYSENFNSTRFSLNLTDFRKGIYVVHLNPFKAKKLIIN